jgi:hypothetical protein
MTSLVVTIVDRRGSERDLELPADIPMIDLGYAIAEAIQHPEFRPEDQDTKYVVKFHGSSQVIPPDRTLGAAGVVHGDRLDLLLKGLPTGIEDSDAALRFSGPGFLASSGRAYLFRGQRVLIGRVDQSAGVVSKILGVDLTELEDGIKPSVSRRHAQVLLRNGDYLLRDLKSTNGTYVNENELGPDGRAVLEHGTVVRFGDVRLVFVWDSQD